MKRYAAVLLSFVLVIGLNSSLALGIFYPKSYIDESVNTMYYPNGSIISEERTGSVEVLTKDVLQDIQLNLSDTNGTDLKSKQAYRSAIASPTGEPTKLYINTSRSERDVNYRIDPGQTPRLDVKIEYENKDGGVEIHSGSNIFKFRVVLDASENMTNANMRFKVPTETGPDGDDSFDLKRQACTRGNCITVDENNNGISEVVQWNGEIPKDEDVVIVFEGEMNPGVNYPPEQLRLDMNDGSYVAKNLHDSTYTDITFTSRLSKDSARNGIYLTNVNGKWYAKGFFQNQADHLRYRIGGWKLYRVGNETPLISSSNETYLNPGESIQTERIRSEEGKKKYFMSSFDWRVVWGDSYYEAETVSDVKMPALYEISSWFKKDLTLEQNDQSETTIAVKDVVRHLGHENVKVQKGEITSEIPVTSEENTTREWSVNDVSLSYRNSTSSYDVTNISSVNVSDPNSNSSGQIKVGFNASRHNITLKQNEDLVLRYNLNSGSKETEENFCFQGQSSLLTLSGTPDIQTNEECITVPGVTKEEDEEDTGGGGGGGGGGISAPTEPRLEIEPLQSTSSVVTGNLVDVSRKDKIIDTGGRGARRIEVQILLPRNGKLRENSVNIQYLKNRLWNKLGTENLTIVDEGVDTVGGKDYHVYDIQFNIEGMRGLTLEDGDVINVSYRAETEFGRNEIITRITGYDYYEDRIFSNDATSPIRVGWELEPIGVEKEMWNQKEAIVKEPVLWTKEIELDNPNDEAVTKTVELYPPQDTISVNVGNESLDLKMKSGRKFAEWEIEVGPQETKKYLARAFTSPVLLERENVRILESEDEWVKFQLNETFMNSAQRYRNVNRILSVDEDNIMSVKTGGRETSTIGIGNRTKIPLGTFPQGHRKKISVIYKEFPPLLIVTTNFRNYTEQNTANITVIAAGTEEQTTGFVEMTIEGPMPDRKTVYSDIVWLHRNKSTEFTKSINLDDLPPGNYSIRSYFRKDFQTILSEKTNFWVSEQEEVLQISDWWVILILILIITAIVPRIYTKKEEYEERLKEIRKKVQKSFK